MQALIADLGNLLRNCNIRRLRCLLHCQLHLHHVRFGLHFLFSNLFVFFIQSLANLRLFSCHNHKRNMSAVTHVTTDILRL